MLISLQDITKSFGSDLIFSNVTAKIEDKDRIGLVGANGAGKTTLLNIITGLYEPDCGVVTKAGSLTIGYQKQNSGLTHGNSIIAEMRSVFADVYYLEERLQQLRNQMTSANNVQVQTEYHETENAFLARDGYNIEVKIKTVLNGMGFADHSLEKEIDKLSGGEQTRLAVAKLLLEEPNLLILDEPTNHLDFKTLAWLEEYLSSYNGGILIVSHDRFFLDKLCNRIWEMDRGELTTFSGNYTKYIALRDERNDRLQKLYDEQQVEKAKLEDYVARNLVRASTTKMAQSRQKMLERLEPIDRPKPPLKPPKIRLQFSQDPVKDVLKVTELSITVGEGEMSKTLHTGVGFHVSRGDKIAIIGGNGTGKTSLLKALIDGSTKSSGKVEWGRGVKYSYYEQGSENLDPTMTVLDIMWEKYPKSYETPLRNMLGALGLTGEDAFKKVSQLSGGERARLKLAIICLAGSNVLLLDEPTNHLDLATKEILEEALSSYEGTIIMVSHDRYLLDKIPTRIFEVERNSFKEYKGKYHDYLEQVSKNTTLASAQTSIKDKCETENQKNYKRGREARREEAKRRKEYTETELLITDLEQELDDIAQKLQQSETVADYLLLQELCALQEEKQKQLADAMDRWLLLSDE